MLRSFSLMESMFEECVKLSNLPDISNWDITNVKNKEDMFKGCKQLKNIPYKFKK